MGRVEAMAAEGLRVLGVARAYFRPRDLPGEQHDFAFEFLGLVGLADPVRPSVPECRTAGIRVTMITEDERPLVRRIQGMARAEECFVTDHSGRVQT